MVTESEDENITILDTLEQIEIIGWSLGGRKIEMKIKYDN